MLEVPAINNSFGKEKSSDVRWTSEFIDLCCVTSGTVAEGEELVKP